MTPRSTTALPGIVKLERVVVAVDDLEKAGADFAALLGRRPIADGVFPLRNVTLQLVDRHRADLPGEMPPAEGVAALVFRQDGRESGEWLSRGETRGILIGLARDGQDEADRAEPAAGVQPEATASALDHVVVSTSDLDAALGLYGDRLGLRLALDRSFPKRGLRILFFRVGGTTVEVVGALPDAAPPEAALAGSARESDRFGGLAWEVEDVAAMHRRLLADGFDVSELRVGHKPGTRVCTVRSRTHGVATLLKGPESA